MTDWFRPLPFLVVAASRGGGTFLCHCLDSHPQVGCERGEPLHPDFAWRRAFPKATPEQLLDLMWTRPGYHAAGCKCRRRDFLRVPPDFVVRRGARVVHLHRENALRIIVSAVINTRRAKKHDRSLAGQYHTYERLSTAHVKVDPRHLLREMERYERNVADMIARVRALGAPSLFLTYAEIVGGEGREADGLPREVGDRLCDFLEVERRPLTAELRRTNPEPLRQIVENWNEVREAVRGTRFERFLEEAKRGAA